MSKNITAYHHFSINNSLRHLWVSFSILLVPLVCMIVFTYATGISIWETLEDVFISTTRLFAGFVFALGLAWVLVVTLVRGKTEGFTLAFFDIMQSLPTFTVLPIGVHFFGESEKTIFLFMVLTVIWPIIFSIVSSVKQANSSWNDAVVMSRIKGFNYVKYYLIPITTPGIVTGSIIGLGEGWEALIATEMLIHIPDGLGPFFQTFAGSNSMTLLGVLMFLSIIFTINKLIWLPLLKRSHALVDQH